jgi:hypothetical protein
MARVIERRFPLFGVPRAVLIFACATLLGIAAPSSGVEDAPPAIRVKDPLGVASFVPPDRWIHWSFWGTAAFSPTTERNVKITFSVTSGVTYTGDQADRAMKAYVRTFSTGNYTLLEKEALSLGGWSGVRVLAQGTERNELFGSDYVWIQEYFTDRDLIRLVFRSDPASFETYRDTVLSSFNSLLIERPRDGQ